MIIGLFIISSTILIKYKPMYNIKLGNKSIGYLQKLENFDNYIEEIKNKESIAFVELKEQPEFKIKFINRNTKNSEEEIKEKIQENLSIEYTSYAITYKNQNIAYLPNMEKAESVISDLKEKENTESLGIIQVYSDNYDEIVAQEKDEAVITVSNAIKKQDKSINKTKLASKNKLKTVADTSKTVKSKITKKTEEKNSKSKKETTRKKDTNKSEKSVSKKLTIGLSKPLSGIITSRFGGRKSPGGIGSTNHKGLDIASKAGTTIKAAASGTVKFAGYKGSLGNLVIIDHGNGIQTYYGHSSKIYVKKGQQVNVGDKIAAVGSTGAATGPHLHFEIHINGKIVNPQNYLY